MCQYGPPASQRPCQSSDNVYVPPEERSGAAHRIAEIIKVDTGHVIPTAVIEALIAGPHWERLQRLAHLVHGRRY